MRSALVFILLSLLGFTSELNACSCGVRPAPAVQFAKADLVFLGEAVDVDDRFHLARRAWTYFLALLGRDPILLDGRYEQRYGFEITFTVDRMWRGPGTKTVHVVTGRGGGDCGIRFERKKRYLVYAYRIDGDEWGTSICSRTREVPILSDDAAFLARVNPLLLR